MVGVFADEIDTAGNYDKSMGVEIAQFHTTFLM
jgi:hypothetical protein